MGEKQNMRRRKIKGADQKLLSYNDYVITEAQKYKGKWKELFGNDNPLHLEVGIGRGSFLKKFAQKHTEINYVGIETKEEVMLYGVRESHEENLKNIKFIWQNAVDLKDFFEKGEIDRIYLNFSDPWPKKRHSRRRLTSASFLEMYKEVLGNNGEVHFKTDHEELFEFSLNSFAEEGWQLKNISLDLYKNLPEDNIPTDYETKFVEKGLRIFRLEGISPACNG